MWPLALHMLVRSHLLQKISTVDWFYCQVVPSPSSRSGLPIWSKTFPSRRSHLSVEFTPHLPFVGSRPLLPLCPFLFSSLGITWRNAPYSRRCNIALCLFLYLSLPVRTRFPHHLMPMPYSLGFGSYVGACLHPSGTWGKCLSSLRDYWSIICLLLCSVTCLWSTGTSHTMASLLLSLQWPLLQIC